MNSKKTVTEIMAQNKIHETPITHSEVDLPSWNPEGKKDATPQTFNRREDDVSES